MRTFSRLQWEITERFQVGRFLGQILGEAERALVHNWHFGRGSMHCRLPMSFDKRYTLGLNFTMEFEIVLKKHTVKFSLFSGIYDPDFSRGRRVSFLGRKKPPRLWMYKSIVFIILRKKPPRLWICTNLSFLPCHLSNVCPHCLCLSVSFMLCLPYLLISSERVNLNCLFSTELIPVFLC